MKKKTVLKDATEDPEQVIPNFYYVLSHLPTEYKKLTSENQKKMIRKVASSIKLNKVSTHVFMLEIEWENGIATHPDIALIWRSVSPWCLEQDDIMRLIYPTASQLELMKTFPNRSWYRIYDRAKELKLRRTIPHNGPHRVNFYHRTVRYDDLEGVSQLVESEEKKERIRSLVNE